MRLVDFVVRQGHLSDHAITEAVITGERPTHLETCDLCGERAVDLGRWLDQVREAAVLTADRAFPPERLAAQQAQILRRIEQLDEPARVIAFPRPSRVARPPVGTRRIAAAWVGVAAAAGLFVGAIGGHLTTRVATPRAATSVTSPAPLRQVLPAPAAPAIDAITSPAPADASLIDEPDEFTPTAMQTLDVMTPALLARSTR